MKLLLATRNLHKVREISRLLEGSPVEIATLDAFPGVPEVDEDQPTLEANARKKAASCAAAAGVWALADDTGLEVEALGGEPGVFSARYAGPGCTYEDNNRKLLKTLEGFKGQKRQARFRTVMALCEPGGRTVLEEGRLDGSIIERPRGSNGFGYDPVFLIPRLGKTLAELGDDEKNSVSHRGDALRKMVPHIKKLALTLAAALLLPIFCSTARATRTEPGQETIWDQIMAGQANRSMRIGERYLDDKRYDLALKEFKAAVAANPKDQRAHLMLGAAYYWNGQVDLSLEEYRAALAIDAQSAQAFTLIGISLAYKGDLNGAYDAFKKSAELDPNRADIQMNLGSTEDSMNRVQDALEHFRKAVAIAPREALYHYQLGSFYRKLGRDQDAAEELRQSLKYNGEFEDALLELGAVDERLKDRKAAIHSFRKAVDLKSRDSVARYRLGRLYLLDGQPKKAREVFADAFHLTPEEGGDGLQLSLSYAGGKKQGPPADADDRKGTPSSPAAKEPPLDPNDPLNVFQRNLERIPLEQAAVMNVNVLFVPKPKLVKANPESASSLRNALRQKLQQEDSGPKVTAVRRDYQLRSASPQERAEQIAKIINDLRETMKGAPAETDVRFGMNLNYTRLAEVQTGRTDASGQPKVSYEPRQVGNDMGLWVIGTGWIALVEDVLPESGESPEHPEQSDWWVATGLGYAVVGDGQRALTAFQKACELDPKNEGALLGRGVAYVMTGNEQAAIDSYREVLKLNPKNRPAGDGLKWLLRPAARAKPAQGGR